MFQCNCCASPRSYSSTKALYKHQRRYDPNYVDPRQKAAEERRAAYEANPVHCAGCNTKLSYEDVASGWKTKFCSQSCAATHNNIERAPFVCECCSPQRRFKSQAALAGHLGAVASRSYVSESNASLRESYYQNPKQCEVCDAIIPYETRRNSKFCSQSCNGKNKETTGKYSKNSGKPCQQCNKPTRWGSVANFCSQKCFREDKYIKFIDDWKQGKEKGGTDISGVSDIVRRYLFEKHESKCSECGWGEQNPSSGKIPLQVDHINGDPNDHSENNLRLICPNCHSLTPTFGALNKGNGRAYRRQRYADSKNF